MCAGLVPIEHFGVARFDAAKVLGEHFHQLRAGRFERRRIVGGGDALAGGGSDRSRVAGMRAMRQYGGRLRRDSTSPSTLMVRRYSSPSGVSRLYSPAIQRGISALYHSREAAFTGAAGQIRPGLVGAHVGDEVVRRGERGFARGRRHEMALKRRGVAAGHGDRPRA